jgi:hypothetical protein
VHESGDVRIENCPKVTTVTLPVHKSGDAWILNCPKVTTVTLPVHESGDVRILNCPKVTTVTLPVHESGSVWILNCPKVTTVTLPVHESGSVWIKDCPKAMLWVEENYGKRPYSIYFSGVLSDGRAMFDNMPCNVLNSKKIKGITVYQTDSKELPIVIFDGENYSHGKTLKEAKDSLIYKLSNRDTDPYKYWATTKKKIGKSEAIRGYRAITGACEAGTRAFVESLPRVKSAYTVKELVQVTRNQFGHDALVKFLGQK